MTPIECLPQMFLQNGRTLLELEATRSVHANRHRRFPQLVQLKYDQIGSPMGDPLVQQCRGIILDESRNWEVVAWPFSKFFNHGEGHAAVIDWQTAKVQEKVDGSLLILYHYIDRESFNSEWLLATSGRADAGGDINGMDMTFEDLALKVLPSEVYKHVDQDLTYMFELTSSYNRVVCLYSGSPRLTLLGARNRRTGEEHAVRDIFLPVPRVREFPLQDLESVLSTFESMSPLSQEGYVIVDQAFNRIKVKHPGYVALHHMKSCLTPRGVLEVVRSGETEEVVTTFPEWRGLFDDVKQRYDNLVTELEAEYELAKSISDQKTFALTIQGKQQMDPSLLRVRGSAEMTAPPFDVFTDLRIGTGRDIVKDCRMNTRVPSALFSRRQGQAIREHLRAMSIDKLAAILALNPREFPKLVLE